MSTENNLSEEVKEFLSLLNELNKDILTKFELFIINANNFDVKFKYYFKMMCCYEDNKNLFLKLVINHESIENYQESYKYNLDKHYNKVLLLSDFCDLLFKEKCILEELTNKIDTYFNSLSASSFNVNSVFNYASFLDNYVNNVNTLESNIFLYYNSVGNILNNLFKTNYSQLYEINGFIASANTFKQEVIVKTKEESYFDETELLTKLNEYNFENTNDFTYFSLLRDVITDYFSFSKNVGGNNIEDGSFSKIRKI